MRINLRIACLIFGVLLLGGCATSRSTVEILPPISEKTSQSNGKEVYINSTVDKRIFEIAPSSPSTPSLDSSEDQSESIKQRAIGRKRNTFGKALGDLVLKEGQNIGSLTNASIRQAFIEKGYRVVDSKNKTSSNTYIVDADIEKFWSWMNPGFFAITLSTEISTNISIKSPDGLNKQTIAVEASGNYQTGVEANWIEVINKAMRAYIDELKAKLN
jgi:uncharacterized lipoprotein YajG